MAEPRLNDQAVFERVWRKEFSDPRGRMPGVKNLAKGLVGAVRDTDPGIPHRRDFAFLLAVVALSMAPLSKLSKPGMIP
ncbi:hypothetical protein ACFSQQ_35935 [Mesorhizobium kowhaii]|jgi:hypothetical protein|uniref:hypothetical protein n=1 Tax=Mesorhizobium kowhaii TaxID=1300272 RepID=UPI0035E7C6EB